MSSLLKRLPVLLLSLSSSAFAADQGRITIVGQGKASAPPEFADVDVTVTSVCYDSSRGAKDANALLANKLVTVLQSFAGSNEHVYALGGPNTRETTYTVDDSGHSQVLCRNKWKATNVLRLRLHHFDSFADLQDQVLAAGDFQMDTTKTAQTYAELGQPSFGLADATLVRLRTEAQGKAYDDAKAQYQAFSSRCNFENSRLESISEPQFAVAMPQRSAPEAGAPTQTPIAPQQIDVNATWQFVWVYDPTVGCFM